jgi:hypothetical protein
VHPYMTRAIAAGRVADWHRKAAASRLARHARLAAMRAGDPGAGPAPIGQPAGLPRAWMDWYRQYWDASFDRLDAHLRRAIQELERVNAPTERTGQ